MFCPNCGYKIEESSKFCPECGKSIPTTETENKIEKKETPEPKKPNKKKHKPMFAVVLTIVFVIGLVGGGLMLFGDKIFSKSYEDILTTGYWRYGDKDESDILLFRTVDNNETFDGIMIIDEDIIPYIIGDDGTVTGFGYSYYLNETTDTYDWEYWPCVTIAIEENEYGENYLLMNSDEGVWQADNIDSGSANDMVISLMFSDWSDYYYKPASLDEYEDHTFHRRVTEQAQRDILFLDFYFSEVGIASYEYGDTDAGLNCSDWESEYYSIEVGEKCIYIDDARFEFNDDFSQLYNAEEEVTLYRVADFHLGKIAYTDFPPGKFVESH